MLAVIVIAFTMIGLLWQPGQPVQAAPTGTPAADSALRDPKHPAMNRPCPSHFKVRFETSRGRFIVLVRRKWAPKGAGRFYNLVRNGYYDECRFFRVIRGFMAQFGIHGDPAVARVWQYATIKDDPVTQSNTRGRITFAKTNRPNSRTTQVFINYKNNSRLDSIGFAPFGEVTEGIRIVEELYAGYGEGAPRGSGPSQERIQDQGNEYLKKQFPKLDYIIKATIMEED